MKIIEIIKLLLANKGAILELIQIIRDLINRQITFGASGEPEFDIQLYPALAKLEDSPEFKSIFNKAA